MRLFLFLPILLFIACSNPAEQPATTIAKSELPDIFSIKPNVKLPTTADSGYIQIQQALDWKLYSAIDRKLALDWKYWLKESSIDTIGKFYKTNRGTYMVCTFTQEGYLLMELMQRQGQCDSIITAEQYRHGNYPCCVRDIYDGFKKINDFYFLKYCITGVGHCSGNMYLFKNITPQGDMNSIQLEARTYCCYLSYTMKLKSDDLTVKYKSQLQPCSIDDIYAPKYRLDYFTVNYHWQNNQWVLPDSTSYKQMTEVFPF